MKKDKRLEAIRRRFNRGIAHTPLADVGYLLDSIDTLRRGNKQGEAAIDEACRERDAEIERLRGELENATHEWGVNEVCLQAAAQRLGCENLEVPAKISELQAENARLKRRLAEAAKESEESDE